MGVPKTKEFPSDNLLVRNGRNTISQVPPSLPPKSEWLREVEVICLTLRGRKKSILKVYLV